MHLNINRRRTLQIGGAGALALGVGLHGRRAGAQPVKGGDVRVGLGHGSTTDSLDPATWENDFTIDLAMAINAYLTEIDPAGELAPELAESWEPSGDAKTWTFRLRQGVTFHDGKELTADDVIASLNHHRGEDTVSAAKVILEPVEDIRADDPHTLVVTLKSGNADFAYLVSDYHLAIRPASEGKIDPSSGVGAGPYVLDSFEPGVRATGSRNPNYFKSDRAHFDTITWLSILDTAARVNALVSGEVDLITEPDLKTVGLLQRRGTFKIETASGNLHYTMPMRVIDDPFTDYNVRMAIKLACNREEMVQTILQGYGRPGNDTPIGPANRFLATEEELPQRAYDPDKAKFHLKEAGMENLKVQLHASDAAYAGGIDSALIYSESARAAGIDIQVVREPGDGYWSNVWLKAPWCMSYYGGRPTEDWMFSTAYESTAAWNETFWDNERFDKLLVEARSELDQDKRRGMYVEMQQILNDQGGQIVPMFADFVWATSDKVAHEDTVASNWNLDGHRWCERWWMTA